MDIATVGFAVAGGSHILSLLKSTAENLRTLGKTDVINDLIEIQLAMMDLLQKHQAILDENRELQLQNRDLQVLIDQKVSLEHHYDAYWLRTSESNLDGPFSLTLWDVERKLVRMRYWKRFERGTDQVEFFCLPSNEHAYVPVTFLKSNHVPIVEERLDEE